MNRREFLLAVGIAGCGATPIASKPARRTQRDAGPGSAVSIADDWSAHYQLSPSPLVLHGNLVARRTPTALEFVDPATLHRVEAVEVAYGAICPADHDSIYAYKSAPCLVERFDRTTSDGALPIPNCSSGPGASMLVAGDSLYLSAGSSFAVYRVDKKGVTEAGKLDLKSNGDTQWFGLADGRMVTAHGHSALVFRAASKVAEWKTTEAIAHLAPGVAGRIWYSAWAPNDKNYIDRVVLAKTETTLATIATFSAARIAHLAAGPDGSVAILAGIAAADATGAWFIVVLDHDGVEQRRLLIPRDVYADIDITSCFVALTATTVLLDTAKRLLGWSLATGASLTP